MDTFETIQRLQRFLDVLEALPDAPRTDRQSNTLNTIVRASALLAEQLLPADVRILLQQIRAAALDLRPEGTTPTEDNTIMQSWGGDESDRIETTTNQWVIQAAEQNRVPDTF